MDTPETLSLEVVRRLAHDLHRRQVLGFLSQNGMSVRDAGRTGSFDAADAAGRTARIDFHPDGAFTCATEDGRRLTRRFDENGDLEELIDPGGLRISTENSADGTRRVVREGHGEFVIRKDADGLPSSITYPDGGEVHFDFDAEGGETVTDQMGSVAKVHRGVTGDIVGVTNRNGHTTRLEEEGSENGSVLTVNTPGGKLHAFGLDTLGQLQGWSLNGAQVAAYSGRLPNGLPREARFHDGHWIRFEAEGDRITAAHNPNGTVQLAYDDAGRVVAEDQNGLIVTYERDATGLLTAIVLPDGERIEYAYDGSGKLSSAKDWSGAVTAIDWSSSGQIAGIRHPNGVETRIGSNALGLITSIRSKGPASGTVLDMAFRHDACDRIVSMREGGSERRFRYDAAGRLTDAVSDAGAFSESWQLDPMGNRTVDNGVAWEVDPDDCVSGPGADAITYDAFGRTRSARTPEGRSTFTYNGQGQFIRAETPHGAIEYAYDAFGRRISKRAGRVVTRYLWAGQTMICEWTEGGGTWRRRDHLFLPDVFLPLTMRVDGHIYRQHCDHRCAPQALTNDRGMIVWQARLRAYGAAVIGTQKIQNPWRLANQYCDEETGLHYNLARYFHPGLGRYLTPDPAFDSASRGNLYIYAANDPLNRCDPTGEIVPLLIAGFVIGAVIAGGIAAYQTRNEPMSWGKAGKIAGAALVGGVVGLVSAATGAAVVAGLAKLGLAAKTGIGAAMAVGAIEGAITGAAEPCAEALLAGGEATADDSLWGALIGGGIGMLTAGLGGLWAARAARKMRKAAKAADGTLPEIAGEIVERKKVGGSANNVEIATSADGSKSVVKKPSILATVNDRVFGVKDSISAEVAAKKVDDALGLGMVPDTRAVTVNGERAVQQEFASGVHPNELKKVAPDVANSKNVQDQLSDMESFDYLMANVDRHKGNYLVDPETGRVTLIDNGMSMATVAPPWRSGGMPGDVTPGFAEKLANTSDQELRDALAGTADEKQIDAILDRRAKLLEGIQNGSVKVRE